MGEALLFCCQKRDSNPLINKKQFAFLALSFKLGRIESEMANRNAVPVFPGNNYPCCCMASAFP